MFDHLARTCLLGSFVVLAAASAVQAAPIRTNCGALINTITLTESMQLDMTSSAFRTVPGASANVTVPSGQTRCVKVRFTTSASCQGEIGSEGVECFIRALANGELNPALGGQQMLATRETTAIQPETNAYQWVDRLGPGTHRVQVQVRRNAAGTAATLKYWTMDIEILE